MKRDSGEMPTAFLKNGDLQIDGKLNRTMVGSENFCVNPGIFQQIIQPL